MKSSLSAIKPLLKKQWIERTYSYRKKNFDILGFLLRFLIVASFVAVFVIFFGKFSDVYLSIKTNGALDTETRLNEMFTLGYTALIAFMTVSAMAKISKELFGADDVKVFAAMPVSPVSLFSAKLIFIYADQFIVSTVAVLTLNLSLLGHAEFAPYYFVMTAAMCFILPFVTISIAALVSLPYYELKRFLSDKFAVTFVLVTVVTAVLFYLYTVIISAVKELLFGDSLMYFFSERIMRGIGRTCALLYPARFISDLLLGKNVAISAVGIVAVIAVCAVVSYLVIRLVLKRALQSRMAGSGAYIKKAKSPKPLSNSFVALIKKEFLHIFRTPSYMFSYFSVAVLMPLMVYTCMSIGSSLVTRLVALDCNVEMAFFLTLLFGALTNVFCATNISRDGQMFVIGKGLPLGCKKIFFSKVVLCLAVTALSQLASAVVIAALNYIEWYVAIALFVTGTAFGFVNICFATRYDFNHAHFSTEDDGEITESSSVVSAMILLGLAVSFLLGGAVFAVRIVTMLRKVDAGYITYIIMLVSAAIACVISYFYLVRGLEKKYYMFDGGNV